MLAVLYAGLLPLFFICWGLSVLFWRKTVKELTQRQRDQMEDMGRAAGWRIGAYAAAPCGLAVGFMHLVGASDVAIGLVVSLVLLPWTVVVGVNERRKTLRFLGDCRQAANDPNATG